MASTVSVMAMMRTPTGIPILPMPWMLALRRTRERVGVESQLGGHRRREMGHAALMSGGVGISCFDRGAVRPQIGYHLGHPPAQVRGHRLAVDRGQLLADPGIAEVPVDETEAHRGTGMQRLEQAESLLCHPVGLEQLISGPLQLVHPANLAETPCGGLPANGRFPPRHRVGARPRMGTRSGESRPPDRVKSAHAGQM